MSKVLPLLLLLWALGFPHQASGLCTSEQAFSVRARIELFQDGKYLGRLRTNERYSTRDGGRAVIEMDISHSSSQQKSTNDEYHHVNSTNTWLRVSQGRCYATDYKKLNAALFGDHPPEPLDDQPQDRLIGAAKLFGFIQKLKRKFFRPEITNIRGLKVAIYQVIQPYGENGTILVQIYYNHLLVWQIMHPETLPFQIELIHQQGDHKRLYTIIFNEFKWLRAGNPLSLDQQVPSLLPISMGCAALLSANSQANQNRSPILETMLTKTTFSFRAKEVDRRVKSESQSADTIQMLTFNLDAKLIRRDIYTETAEMTTIYDFGQSKKYFKHRDTRSDCFLVKSSLATANYMLADFDQLQFMGQAHIDGSLVNIFEQENPNSLPFWLFPTVSTTKGSATGSSLEMGQQVLNNSRISLVYYFAEDREQLIRIDIQVKDVVRNEVLMQREVQITSFETSPKVSSFSLAELCPPKSSNAIQRLHLEALLEPVNSSDNTIAEVASEIADKSERDRLIAQALELNLGLSMLEVVSLSSKRVRNSRSLLQPLSPINLDVKISRIQCPAVKWINLGRAEFLHHSALVRLEAVGGLESCAWLAACHRQQFMEEVVFSLSKTNECFIGKLYRSQSNNITNSRSLNIYPYEFGHYEMFSVHLDPEEPSNEDWPMLQLLKPFNIIGKRITLKSQKKPIQYSVKHATLKGDLVRGDTPRSNEQQSIDQISWSSTTMDTISKMLVKQVFVDNDMRDRLMTRHLCHSMCLLDIQCRSYSYCDRSAFKQAECYLSKVNIESESVINQLKAHLEACSDGKRCKKRADNPKLITVLTSDSNESSDVAITVDTRCSTRAKSYEELFTKSFTSKLNVEQLAHQQTIQVKGSGECARLCFEKNLIYLKGAIRHRLNLTQVHQELIDMMDQEVDVPTHLESVLDWHKQNLKSLCVSYQFTEESTSHVKLDDISDVRYPCILSDHSSATMQQPIDMFAKPQSNLSTVLMQNYKLNYLHLFQRTYGFHMIQGNDNNENEAVQVQELDAFAKLKHLLILQQAGFNRQARINTDDVSYCARACVLQTHGPKPSCSSFDLVLEHETGQRYCLLNSQSVHDLKRKNRFESQLQHVNNSKQAQYWHYEPQDSLLSPTDNLDDEDELSAILLDGSSLLSKIASKIRPRSEQASAFILPTLYLFIVTLGLSSGLLLGAVSAKWYDNHMDKNQMDDTLIGNKVVRLVHRLSGVSICSQMLEREVRM